MTLTIELTPEQESTLTAEATARGLALPEFVKLRALENVPTEAHSTGYPEGVRVPGTRPASGEELEAMFEQWKADAKDTTPEEDAAWDQMERNLRDGGVTMRRVDVSDCE
jgi:hypothetical protein